jgi:hypothetical protein
MLGGGGVGRWPGCGPAPTSRPGDVQSVGKFDKPQNGELSLEGDRGAVKYFVASAAIAGSHGMLPTGHFSPLFGPETPNEEA